MNNKNTKIDNIVIALGTLVIMVSLFTSANTPLIRNSDSNSVRYTLFARNINRLSPQQHKFTNINAVTPLGLPESTNTKVTYYLDHPPLITILTAINFSVLGESALSARLVPILSTLIATIFLYQTLGLFNWPKQHKFIFLSLIILNPLFIEHGQTLNFEPTTFALITVSYYFLTKSLINSSFTNLVEFFILWGLGLWCDWPAYFAAMPFFLIAYSKNKKLAFTIFLYAFVNFAILMLYYATIDSKFVTSFLIEQLLLKHTHSLNWGSFVHHQVYFAISNYSKPIIILCFAGVIAIKTKASKYLYLLKTTLPFWIIGGFNILLFLSWADQHHFWSYYLIPGILSLALTGGLYIYQKINWKISLPVLLLLVIWNFRWTQIFVSAGRNNNIITLQQLNNLNSINSSKHKLYAFDDVYTTKDGLSLRYLLDQQLNVIDSNQFNSYLLVSNDYHCPNQEISVSTFYKLCL